MTSNVRAVDVVNYKINSWRCAILGGPILDGDKIRRVDAGKYLVASLN